VIVRVRGRELTGTLQIDGRKTKIQRPRSGEPRWIIGGAESKLFVSDIAAWDKYISGELIAFLSVGFIPKWIYDTPENNGTTEGYRPQTFPPELPPP
jgi:hypothetical protein